MAISGYSFLMAVLWSSIVIMVQAVFLVKSKFIRQFGIGNLMFLCCIGLFRLLIPIETPFTYIFNDYGFFADIVHVLHFDVYSFFGFSFTITGLLMKIWILGSMVNLIHWGIHYIAAVQKIKKWQSRRDSQSEELLLEVKTHFRRQRSVEVWRSGLTEIPMGIGVFYRRILLPEHAYSQQELYCILLHEYTHFINYDTAVKFLLQIICCVFWWNPFVYIMKRELTQTMEIKCDLTAVDTMEADQKSSYLDTIISVIQNCGKETKDFASPSVQLFHPRTNAVIERFRVIVDEQIHPSGRLRSFYHGVTLALTAVLVCTYFFQIQAAYEPPEEEFPPELALTPEEAFFIDNEDGTYTIMYYSSPDVKDLTAYDTDNGEIIQILAKQDGFHLVKRDEVEKEIEELRRR